MKDCQFGVSQVNYSDSDSEVLAKMNLDLKVVLKWCRMWNMPIAPEKTEVMAFTPGNENVKDEWESAEKN